MPVGNEAVPPFVRVLDVDLALVFDECPGGVSLASPRWTPVPVVDGLERRSSQLLDVLFQILNELDSLFKLNSVAERDVAVFDSLHRAFRHNQSVTGLEVALVVAPGGWWIAKFVWRLLRDRSALHFAAIFPGIER